METVTFRTATIADLDSLVGVINRAFVVERPLKAGGDRVDHAEVAKVQKKLDDAKVRLARENGSPKP